MAIRCALLVAASAALVAPLRAIAASVSAPASAESAARPPERKHASDWVFSLLPKSMQANPRLDLTVITEMTEEGKKLPPVSADKPAFFEVFSAGYKPIGEASGGGKILEQAEIEKFLVRALAANGYQPARQRDAAPSLFIVYVWGTHNRLVEGSMSGDGNIAAHGRDQAARNFLDRAAMVGGDKLAKEMMELLQQTDALSIAATAQGRLGGPLLIPPTLIAFADPVNLYKLGSRKKEFLFDQSNNDIYYVVASAYDYASAATNKKRLLWRTRMTVASLGVSLEQALPTLVLSAAPYFGKDMPEPEVFIKRAMREATVEVGTPIVVEPEPPRPETLKN